MEFFWSGVGGSKMPFFVTGAARTDRCAGEEVPRGESVLFSFGVLKIYVLSELA